MANFAWVGGASEAACRLLCHAETLYGDVLCGIRMDMSGSRHRSAVLPIKSNTVSINHHNTFTTCSESD